MFGLVIVGVIFGAAVLAGIFSFFSKTQKTINSNNFGNENQQDEERMLREYTTKKTKGEYPFYVSDRIEGMIAKHRLMWLQVSDQNGSRIYKQLKVLFDKERLTEVEIDTLTAIERALTQINVYVNSTHSSNSVYVSPTISVEKEKDVQPTDGEKCASTTISRVNNHVNISYTDIIKQMSNFLIDHPNYATSWIMNSIPARERINMFEHIDSEKMTEELLFAKALAYAEDGQTGIARFFVKLWDENRGFKDFNYDELLEHVTAPFRLEQGKTKSYFESLRRCTSSDLVDDFKSLCIALCDLQIKNIS